MVSQKLSAILVASLLLGGCGAVESDPTRVPEPILIAPFVGQGSGVLVRDGDQTIAFDAGPDSSSTLSRILRSEDIAAVDLVVISHWDLDHVGGLDTLIGRHQVHELVYGSEPVDAWMRTVKEHWCRQIPSGCQLVHPGQALTLANNLRLEFLFADTAGITNNERSLVVRLATTRGEGLLLAPGDLDTSGEARLLGRSLQIQAQILLTGHHGSRSSSSLPFLGAARPLKAIIQAAPENPYGHPHAEALERLRRVTGDIRWIQPGETEQIPLGLSL